MCEVATILAIGSAVVGAYGTVQQNNANKEMAYGQQRAADASYQQQQAQYTAQIASNDYNAKVAENNAKITEWKARDATARGEEAAIEESRKTSMLKGAQRTALAARGLDVGDGTALTLQDQTDFFGAVDKNTTRYNAAKEAWGYSLDGQNAESTRTMLNYDSDTTRAGKNAQTGVNIPQPKGGGLAVAGSLLTGAGKVADSWYKYNPPAKV